MAGGGGAVTPYSRVVGFIYLFNLIVGVGALTLPLVFQQAGFVLGIFLLTTLALLSFLGVTFMLEAMAAANSELFVEEYKPLLSKKGGGTVNDLPVISGAASAHSDDGESVSPYEIKQRAEFGMIARLFLPPLGQVAMYFILVLYLYGDLAIYASSVPVSAAYFTGNTSIVMGQLVWTNNWSASANPLCVDHTCVDLYYFYLILFSAFVLPFCFFRFENTKPLQIITMATRNIALISMIVVSLIYIGQGCPESCDASKGQSIANNGSCCPTLASLTASRSIVNFEGLPFLFGAAIYSFMCTHSLPSLITPIKNKRGLRSLLFADFMLILAVYITLCMSALFAFDSRSLAPDCSDTSLSPCRLQQLYTLNFSNYHAKWLADFLVLFPVFTLTTNFPLICITLRNNLTTLVETLIVFAQSRRGDKARNILTPYMSKGDDVLNKHIRRGLMPLAASIPPLVIALLTKEVDTLVGITGSFAGIGVIFVFPAVFVIAVRRRKGGRAHKKEDRQYREKYFRENVHSSPMRSDGWAYLLFVASVLSIPLAIWHLATS